MRLSIIVKCLFGGLLLVTMALGACKKSDSGSALQGSWTEETYTTTINRRLIFNRDSIHFVFTNASMSELTSINGTFSTQGNKLITNFTNITVKGNGVKNSQTGFTGNILENATYAIQGNRLTLNYTTYPADAPVSTTMILNRHL